MPQRILELRVSHKGIKPVRNGHPWIFKNALAGPPQAARVSSAVERSLFGPDGLVWERTAPAVICDQSGEPLGWGTYNRHSRLAVRMISRDAAVPFVGTNLTSIIHRAVMAREKLFHDPQQEAFRLLFGEADGVPGIVADLFGRFLSIQYSGAFAWDNAARIEEGLSVALDAQGMDVTVVRRIDESMFEREGIPVPTLPDAYESVGTSVTVKENGLPWSVQPGKGQKTGLYCDQRDNRRYVEGLSPDKRVLDAFCYHGGFGFHALRGGARHVCFADSSSEALGIVRQNGQLQGVDESRYQLIDGDLFQRLRNNDVPGGIESYDLVILDPPKLAPSRRNVPDGLRAYKDLNMSVLRRLPPGARLVTFSCSGAVNAAEFRRVLAWAAADCRRNVRIEGVLSHAPDHPIPLAFPEAEYLKGLVLLVE